MGYNWLRGNRESGIVIAKRITALMIPVEPGTCIKGGFLPMALEYERVTFGIRLKEFTRIGIS